MAALPSSSTNGDLAGQATVAPVSKHSGSDLQHSRGTGLLSNGKKWKKWKPGLWGRIKDFLTSPYFKACAQLASGQFIISMFVFVNKLSFTLSCLASIFFYIGVILRQDQHVASFLMAGFKTAGCILTGGAMGGIVLECIKILGQQSVGYICLFGVLGLLVTSSVRVTADLGTGLINGVIYGIVVVIAVIPGRPPRTSRGIWEQVVIPFWYNGWLVALADIIAGCFVLTSLARQDVKHTSAKLIAGVGHSLSGYASIILKSDEEAGNSQDGTAFPVHPDSLHKQAAPVGKLPSLSKAKTPGDEWFERLNVGPRTPTNQNVSKKNISVQMEMDQEGTNTCDEYMDFLEEVSRPDRERIGYVPVKPCLKSLRPLLVTLRRVLTEAEVEPPWADNCSMEMSAWKKLADCMSTLALRNAALETLLEEDIQNPRHVLSSSALQEMLGADVMPLFRLLFAQMAASCAALAFALREAASGKRAEARLRLLLEPSYAVLEFELASALHCIINSHWSRLLQNAAFRPTVQVRVLMYLGVLCSGMLESLADVEKAAVAALSAPHHQKRVWTAIKRALHISSNKVDDPEDPSGTCSARKKQALHQTWLDMLSATNTAFQNGGDRNGGQGGMHNSASAPTLYYGSSQRPLQVQAPHELMERFSSNSAFAKNQQSSAWPLPPHHDSQSPPAQTDASLSSTSTSGTSQHKSGPTLPAQHDSRELQAEPDAFSGNTPSSRSQHNTGPASPPQQDAASHPAPPLSNSLMPVRSPNKQEVPAQESFSDPITLFYRAGSEASPRVRLTPNGVVHMGLRNASPTPSQDPQQRRAALLVSPARSHDLTQRLARGSNQGPQDILRALQAGHTPDRQGSSGGSAGAAHGLPSDPMDPRPTLDNVQHGLGQSPQAEVELTGTGNSTNMDRVQTDISSMKSIQAEVPEEEELLSLRPTRDFVEHFNQHTSFHRRKIIRNAMEESSQRSLDSEDSDSSGVDEGAMPDASGKDTKAATGKRRKSRLQGILHALWQRVKEELGWTWPHLQNLSGFAFFQAIYGVFKRDIPESFSSKESMLQALTSKKLHFFFKYLLASATVMCVVLTMLWFIPGFHAWNPIYCMTTVAVVLSEKVDTTLSKGVLRIAGTLVGGSLGFVVMLHSSLATNPYALTAVVCAATFVVAPITLTVYRYAAFLTLITFHSLILCQYKPIPGNHGSLTLFYARVTDIAVGVCVVLLFDLIMPWYASADALEKLGVIYREGTGLLEGYYDAFYNETRLAGKSQNVIEEETGVAALEKDLLQQKIARPISELQTSLQREQVLWKKGLLVIPAIVYDLLNTIMLFQDRLEAVEVMLLQKPIVSGRYTGYAFRHFVLPLDAHFRTVWKSVRELGKTVEAILSSRKHPNLLQQLHDNVDSLQKSRVALRRAYIKRHHEFIASVQKCTTLERTPDDTLRFQSVTFSLVRALDKCVLTARLVADDEWIHEHVRSGRWQQRRLWLGLPSNKGRKGS